jgi:hypothetical protein
VDLPGGGYARKAFRLTAEERRTYYLGYANSVLWPLCHRRSDLIDFERAFAEGYLAVNRRVARAVAALAGPDDLIWIHDYHFLPLAAMLRAQGVTARIGLFLHIPFPVLADLDALPERGFPGLDLGLRRRGAPDRGGRGALPRAVPGGGGGRAPARRRGCATAGAASRRAPSPSGSMRRPSRRRRRWAGANTS